MMTPFWRPLAKGTSRLPCKLQVLLTTIIQVFNVLRMNNSFISINKLIFERLENGVWQR
jgi:hypothetical protein